MLDYAPIHANLNSGTSSSPKGPCFSYIQKSASANPLPSIEKTKSTPRVLFRNKAPLAPKTEILSRPRPSKPTSFVLYSSYFPPTIGIVLFSSFALRYS